MGDMPPVSNGWIPLPPALSEGLDPVYNVQLQAMQNAQFKKVAAATFLIP